MSNSNQLCSAPAVRISALASVLLACVAMALAFARPADASFGIESFTGLVANQDSSTANLAAAHPYSVTTTIRLNSHVDEEDNFSTTPDGDAKDVSVDLPPGFVGNTTAVPKCDLDTLLNDPGFLCPAATQVGLARFYFTTWGDFGAYQYAQIYAAEPSYGTPAQFAFQIAGVITVMTAKLRDDGTYALQINTEGLTQKLGIVEAKVTFWGVPADSSHDQERHMCMSTFEPTGNSCPSSAPKVAFLTNPANCSAGALTTTMRATSWNDPGVVATASFDHDTNGEPMAVQDCERVPFEPRMEARPGSTAADTPSGLEVDLHVPQFGLTDPNGRASAPIKRVEVAFPEGVSINPASSDGLAACSPQQIGLESKSPLRFDLEEAQCPAGSKIGSVAVESPLIEGTLAGGIYLAEQNRNAFDSLLSIYMVAENKERGIRIKLPGRVDLDPASGRLTAVFDDNPQLPFTHLHAEFKQGSRAPLITPPACGTYTTVAKFTPWSAADPDNPTPEEIVTSASSFEITSGPDGAACPDNRFDPTLEAGTVNPLAGAHSPFLLRLSREDGSQRLSSLTMALPEGLLGTLRGIPYCPEAVLAAVPAAAGTAAGELAAPRCPASSQVGTVDVGAGAGPTPFDVRTGRAYLAGPYKGAPLSMAFVTPALAGPFDLGNVVVRAALQVDPGSARITAVSDPLPSILHGIPLDLRNVRVSLGRDGFMLNPTSCDPMAITGSATSMQGATAPLSDRFQVAGCEGLGFKPKLSLKLSGPTHRSAHPALKATLTMPNKGANIGKAVVTLPPTEFLENAHIRTICTRVQYAAERCPKASIYGYAKAWTPLLDKPLQGPVYLRSSNHTLPDLVASLDGQIHIDLPGRIDSPGGKIRNTFWAVPDAPVSKFVLTMQGGKKGLLVNNEELCDAKPRARAEFTGQNGKRSVSNPLVKVGCGKSARGR